MKERLNQTEKNLNKLRVRLFREKQKSKKGNLSNQNTPTKKVTKLFGKCKVDSKTRKEIICQRALLDEVVRKVKNRKKGKSFRMRDLVGPRIVKRYKMRAWLKKEGVGVSFAPSKPLGRRGVKNEVRQKIHNFFLTDDVSTMTAAKKSTITRNGVKKQRRLLQNTLLELHARYNADGGANETVSYATFCRLRPFWVVQARLCERATCECTKCFNLELMLDKLRQENVIHHKSLDEMMKTEFCDPVTYQCVCMLECNTCKTKSNHFNEDNIDKTIQWQQWKNKEVDLSDRRGGEAYVTRVTALVDYRGTVQELITALVTDLDNKSYIHLFEKTSTEGAQ